MTSSNHNASINHVYIYIYNIYTVYIYIHTYSPRNSDLTLFDHKYVGFPRILYHFPQDFSVSGLSRRSAGPPGAGGSVSAGSPAAAGSWPCEISGGPDKIWGEPLENHRKTIGKWWFNGI